MAINWSIFLLFERYKTILISKKIKLDKNTDK